jgi:hypothetical protein
MKGNNFEDGSAQPNEAELYIERERQRAEQIQSATDFDSLYEVLRNIGEIQGSSVKYPPEKIIGYIDGVRKGVLMNLQFITRKYGLRDKFEELTTAETEGK